MPLWIMTMALSVLAAAAGVKARSLDTTIAIMVRPSGVVPISSTLTNREARSKRWASSTASAYGAVSFQSDFSPVVSRSRRASLVLVAREAAALAAGGSKAECGARTSWASPIAPKAHAHEMKRIMCRWYRVARPSGCRAGTPTDGLQWISRRLRIAAQRRAAGAMFQDDSGKGAQRLIGLP